MNTIYLTEGKTIELRPEQRAIRLARQRASKIGEPIQKLFAGMQNPNRAEFCLAALIWAFMPFESEAKYPRPELLGADLDDDKLEDTMRNLVEFIDSLDADDEKKSTSKNSPSPKSSSTSKKKTGKRSTPRTRKR